MSIATIMTEGPRGKLQERVGIPLSSDMLAEIRRRAKANKRKYLDEIRHLIEVGLQAETGDDWRSAVTALQREIDALKARGSPLDHKRTAGGSKSA